LTVLLVLTGAIDVQAQAARSLRWSVKELSDGREAAGTPAIVADGTGAIHLFWTQRDDEKRTGAIYYGRTDGQRWFVNDILPEMAANPQAAVDSAGVLHLIWLTAATGELRYSYAPVSRADSPRAWAEPRTLTYGPAFSPRLLFDPAGVLHIVYTTTGETSEILYLRSTDNGRTWSRPALIFESPSQAAAADRPRLALAPNGTLHMVWGLIPKASFYGGLGAYYARSADSGQTWVEPVRLRGPDEGAWQASIAVVGNDEIHVVWNSHTQSGKRHHQWSRDGGRTWSVPQPIWGSFVSQTGPNPMIVDAAGTLYLLSSGTFAWGERQGIRVSRWTGSSWADPEPVDLSSEEPHWLEVAITEGNTLHLVWEAREQTPRGMWYATAKTTAPYVAPPLRSYPSVPTAARQATPTAVPPAAATRPLPPAFTEDPLGSVRGVGDPQPAIGSGVVPVLILVGAVSLFQILWLRRQ
jgi:hypothetical protein